MIALLKLASAHNPVVLARKEYWDYRHAPPKLATDVFYALYGLPMWMNSIAQFLTSLKQLFRKD